MATISTTNFLALADNIAKTCMDMESAFITNPGANAPTIATVTAGITNLQTRVAGLNDIAQESALSTQTLTSTTSAIAFLTFSANTFYNLYAQLMNALEAHVSGVSSFISTNTLMVHPEFAAAFNYYATNAATLGLSNKSVTKVPTSVIFVPAEVTLGTIAEIGAAAGTFTVGSTVDTTKYSAGQALYVKNTGAGALTAGASITITYKDVNNATQTANYTSTALAAGATAALSVNGQAVTNIVVNSGGTNGNQIAVVAEPTRTIAY